MDQYSVKRKWESIRAFWTYFLPYGGFVMQRIVSKKRHYQDSGNAPETLAGLNNKFRTYPTAAELLAWRTDAEHRYEIGRDGSKTLR